MRRLLIAGLLIAAPLLLATEPVLAQDEAPDLIPEELSTPADGEGEDQGKEPGWHPMLTAAGNMALAHNKNVVGNADGLNLTLGYLIDGGIEFLNDSKEHEWINHLNWQLSYTKTPAFDLFLKSLDSFDFLTAYLYHVPAAPWFGPFGAFRIKATVFPGYDVRAEETTIQRLDVNGDPIQRLDLMGNPTALQVVDAGDKIRLTDGWAPTTLRETVGLFAIPLDREKIRIDVRAGWGFWETFVRDGWTIADNEETPELELQQMQDVVQLGPEINLSINGNLQENVMYAFNSTLMYPVWMSVETELEGIEKLNTEFEFLLGVKLAKWVSLDYSFKAFRLPMIVDAWQIQNGLLLSLTATFT